MKILIERNLEIEWVKLLVRIYDRQEASMGTQGTDFGNIYIGKGVKQGASTSPLLFNLIIDELIKEMKFRQLGLSMTQKLCGIFAFADDILLIARNEQEAN